MLNFVCKRLGISMIPLLSVFFLHAQKRVVDSTAYGVWENVANGTLSNDGKYVYYTISNRNGLKELHVQSVDKKWKLSLSSLRSAPVSFSNDSKKICYLTPDTLVISWLGTNYSRKIPNVKTFSVPQEGLEDWLLIENSANINELFLYNIPEKQSISLGATTSYLFASDGNAVILIKKESEEVNMQLFDLKNRSFHTIWKGRNCRNIIWDKSNTKLAFIYSEKINDEVIDLIGCYNLVNKLFVSVAKGELIQLHSKLSLNNIFRFNPTGEYLLVNFIDARRKQAATGISVDVWSFKDSVLQSLQQRNLTLSSYFSVSLLSNTLVQLSYTNERFLGSDFSSISNIGLVSQSNSHHSESYWYKDAEIRYFIINMLTGKRTPLNISPSFFLFRLSPSGKYILMYDSLSKGYYSYEIESGSLNSLTTRINTNWFKQDNGDRTPNRSGIAAWVKNEESVIIYDEHDLWKIDLTGDGNPINITNGYGKKKGIVFKFASDYTFELIMLSTEVVLNAFNKQTKETGFYKFTLGEKRDPEKLCMGSYLYEYAVRAKKLNLFLVIRMAATQSPNYFVTTDFRKFSQISFVFPENRYNWLTTELHSWNSIDGKTLQGILFKPENFDSTKRYPLIFHVYESWSYDLNKYRPPSPSTGSMNIATFVSNGYLVFTPDIYYTIGQTGKSALNSVISAAKYLSGFPFVDTSKLGIQGSSFGGFETNYIITHSKSFAAASEGSGVSNMISEYGNLRDGLSREEGVEKGQYYLGNTLWSNPQTYIENSPVFYADRITTPLLIMHNKNDGAVLWDQALQFFIALRRLGKRCWWLQYDNGEHGVWGNDALDYTKRQMQFFDHYLKDLPPPFWMTKGVPATLKGSYSGFDIDSNVSTPGTGL